MQKIIELFNAVADTAVFPTTPSGKIVTLLMGAKAEIDVLVNEKNQPKPEQQNDTE